MRLSTPLGDDLGARGRHWGKADVVPWLPRMINLYSNEYLRGLVDMDASFAGAWDLNWIMFPTAETEYVMVVATGPTGGGVTATWQLDFKPTTENVDLVRPVGGTSTIGGIPMNGVPRLVHFRATQNGGNVDYELFTTDLLTGATGGASGSITTALGSVKYVEVRTLGLTTDPLGVGHVVAWAPKPTQFAINTPAVGHRGEAAGRRLERLCAEEGIPFAYVGDLDDTPAMGPQGIRPILALLRECESVDMGILYESRSVVGLAYRTLGSMSAQDPTLILDYAAGQVSPPLRPVRDQKRRANKVTAKRLDGGTFTHEQTSGPLNTGDPGTDSEAVGVYDDEVTVNCATDDQLPGVAQRLVARGTVAGDRFPAVTVNLAASDVRGDTDLEAALMAVEVGDRMVIENMGAVGFYDPIDQLARGYVEHHRDQYGHEVEANTAPYAPYDTFVLDVSRLDGESTLTADLPASGAATFQAAPTGASLWTTDVGDFPLDVFVGGERVTISTIIGAASPQTFTVAARAVNGVVKSHVAGSSIRPADVAVLG